ncbi:hypothetical protein [Paludibacterium paludis]|uniref:Uncharacterized protein n=1 Tax=Paludibacterium paludis TaxID=1225769 RepID=A0A918U8L4_9NEIS|nr:hypothetical protein [Paludibacterium paludis]GGY10573.1 hypothetical protein GCM10011289_11670 [Paludibacterium paludis]
MNSSVDKMEFIGMALTQLQRLVDDLPPGERRTAMHWHLSQIMVACGESRQLLDRVSGSLHTMNEVLDGISRLLHHLDERPIQAHYLAGMIAMLRRQAGGAPP